MVDISTKAIERMAAVKPKCGYLPVIRALAEELKTQQAATHIAIQERDTVRAALKEVHGDLIMRAKFSSKDGETVAVGRSCWIGICNALEAVK